MLPVNMHSSYENLLFFVVVVVVVANL